MASRQEKTDARPKVKEERLDSTPDGMWGRELGRSGEHMDCLRRTARRLAVDAGFTSSSGEKRTGGEAPPTRDATRNADKVGGAHISQLQVKTPKYTGKADWDAFHAQFELLARAMGWSETDKALQLALCLTEDALSCLLLLSPSERDDYGALVGALRRRFGQCNQPGVLRSELSNRQRQPGEPLRLLANDIETLTRRAYAHMPTDVQGELARDQFIRAIVPRELRIQTQLAHPGTLQEALELALEREIIGGLAGGDNTDGRPIVRTAVEVGPSQEEPAWAAELTELIRAVSLQPPRDNTRPRRGPPVCWTCGQAGHISVRCPKQASVRGNGTGSA